jgi:hypothetical protein
MTSRRRFLAGLAALTLPVPGWADAGSPRFLAAGRQDDRFVLHGLSARGETVFALDLPGRGHAACAHPVRPLAVAFARRPGTFAVVLECLTGAVTARLVPPQGRQFNGHGAFSADGTVLFTSELVAETSEGRIGLWRFPDFRRIGDWASGGIGPHEVRLLPDGRLVVANGGIRTDPQDRRKLNLDTMRPNLTVLSAEGRIEAQAELAAELRQNSIRHLAVNALGTVAFALQWEGDPAEPVPQLGLWQPGGAAPRLCPPDAAGTFAMQGYAGSVALTESGLIAVTSPRGGVVMIHDAEGKPLASHARADVCGIAAEGGGFVASDGSGALWACTVQGITPLRRTGPQWDNHFLALG